MTAKHFFGWTALAVAAVLGFGLFFRSNREAAGRNEPSVIDKTLAVLPPSTGTVVRAQPPSALGIPAVSARSVSARPSLKEVAVVTDAASHSLDARLAALSFLGKSMPASDVDALLAFLDRRDSGDALPPEKLNALKNDVANLLRAQSKFPDALPWHLAAMWRDPGHDGVWRDYCLQHAGAAWDRIGDPAARREVRSVIWDAATNTAAPGSGTALIALRNLALSGNERKANAAAGAFASAASAVAPEGVRVTALQIAAELGASGTAALARSLLFDRSQPVHLRMSAAAALGKVGDSSDLPALETLASASDPRLRTAASSAVRKLSETPSQK
jgi:hypothetical protein